MKIIMLGAAMAASLVTAPAFANPRDRIEVVSITVSTAGHDLTRPRDVARLKTRLDSDIRLACTASPTNRYLAPVDEQCVANLTTTAHRHVDQQVQFAMRNMDRAKRG